MGLSKRDDMAIIHIVQIDQRTDLKKTMQEWLSICFPSLNAEFVEASEPSISLLVNTDVFQITATAYYLQKRQIEFLSFMPSIILSFRMLPTEQSKKSALPLLKQACVNWLKTTNTNLVFLFDGEKGVIARTKNVILLNTQWWATEELDKLGFKYEEESFDL